MNPLTYRADRNHKYEPYIWFAVFSITALFLFFSLREGLKIMEVENRPLLGFLFALLALFAWGSNLKKLLDSLFSKPIRSLEIDENELSISFRTANFKLEKLKLTRSESRISFEDYWEDARKQRINIFVDDGQIFTLDLENWTENLLREIYANLRKSGYRKHKVVA
ncbi:MAG: hypothetical protein R8P61_30555 [Bacteroidia bacterium]|nr:hypothetical protein [Bacteroidia bacterium]